MPTLVEARVASARAAMQHAAAALDALDPLATLERGYAIVRAADGGIVMDAASRRRGEHLSVTLAKGALDVSVDGVRDSVP
jgi:exodeoxyribonuclease VII large subunit